MKTYQWVKIKNDKKSKQWEKQLNIKWKTKGCEYWENKILKKKLT